MSNIRLGKHFMRERDEVRTGRKFTLAACLHEAGTKSQVEMKNTNIQNLL